MDDGRWTICDKGKSGRRSSIVRCLNYTMIIETKNAVGSNVWSIDNWEERI